MKLTCRSCGATGSAEAVFGDADAAEALRLAGELDPLIARAVWHYLALHRPAQRALTWSRTEKLLREILDLVSQPTIRRHHRDWAVVPAMWREAMDHMQAQRDKLTLPLKGHGYLLEIVAGMADKQEAGTERAREQGIRCQSSSRSTGEAQTAAAVDVAVIDLHGERAARKRLGMPAMTKAEETEYLRQRRSKAP
ncbi:MAG: hypothetical protein NTZ11_10735 [Gammaproteobacteria bacterium]|nr:hypothetical protein [Gammaproteobacteria bacterium]